MRHHTIAAFLFTVAIAAAAAAQSDSAAKPGDAKIMENTMQVTGVVTSSEANRLVVKTDKGQEMVFIITDKQVDASLFHSGDRVTASYVTLAGTGAVVTKVVAYPAAETTTVTTYTPPPAETRPTTVVETRPAAAPAPAPRAVVAPLSSSTYDTTAQRPTTPRPETTLPATAGPMPLVALIGLLGAGGAATIRRFRRS